MLITALGGKSGVDLHLQTRNQKAEGNPGNKSQGKKLSKEKQNTLVNSTGKATSELFAEG